MPVFVASIIASVIILMKNNERHKLEQTRGDVFREKMPQRGFVARASWPQNLVLL